MSINVTAELDQALLARPDALQRKIGDLCCKAQNALDRHADALGDPQPCHNGSGERRDAAMTASQRRAILAIIKRWDINLDAE